jgi:hypothetical protein
MYRAAALHTGLFLLAYGSMRLLKVLAQFTAPPPTYQIQPGPTAS